MRLRPGCHAPLQQSPAWHRPHLSFSRLTLSRTHPPARPHTDPHIHPPVQALFTIVATGTDGVVANLVKQIGKLVNVRYVEDITDESHVERELMLIKVGGWVGGWVPPVVRVRPGG